MGTTATQGRHAPHTRAATACVAAALLLSAPVSAAVSDFELPPAPSEAPEVQGPVIEGIAPPQPTQVDPTPTPSPRPIPTITPQPTATPTAVVTPAPQTTRDADPAIPEPTTQTTAPDRQAAAPASSPTDDGPAASTPTPREPTAPAAIRTPAPAPAISAEATGPAFLAGRLAQLLGGAGLLGLLAASAWFWWRRRSRSSEIDAPVVERPIIRRPEPAAKTDRGASVDRPRESPVPTFGMNPAAESATEETLSLAIEARQLAISLTAATLSYRITLTNSGPSSLKGVSIAGDMIGAHASRSQAEQIAAPESMLAHCHSVDVIPAGGSVEITGDFRLPLPMIQPIRRGDLALFVPLARLRVEAAEGGNGAIVKTALIGQRSTRPGSGLQPFRLDLGPRIYREVTQKIFS